MGPSRDEQKMGPRGQGMPITRVEAQPDADEDQVGEDVRRAASRTEPTIGEFQVGNARHGSTIKLLWASRWADHERDVWSWR